MSKPVCPACGEDEQTRVQSYLPDDARVSAYVEGRCKVCGATWDLSSGQLDHETKVRNDGT